MALFVLSGPAVARAGDVEPAAGSWKTPARRTSADIDAIGFWDAGSPTYRWVELTLAQLAARPLGNPRNTRLLALLNVAMYDATVAARDAKYFYKRPRPTIGTTALVPLPQSPSYPAEHAVVAGAAAAVLSYAYPDGAAHFAERAREAARSRVLAGVHDPSDVSAGLVLGRAVAERVLARARADGADTKWTAACRRPRGGGGAVPFLGRHPLSE